MVWCDCWTCAAATITRHRIGDFLGALGSAVAAAIFSAAVTLLTGAMTGPPSIDERGFGISPGSGHAIEVYLIDFCYVLPAPVVVGAAFPNVTMISSAD